MFALRKSLELYFTMACTDTGHHHTHKTELHKIKIGTNGLKRVECSDLDPIQKYAINQGSGVKLEWKKGSKAMIHYTTVMNDLLNDDQTKHEAHSLLKLPKVIADSNVDVDPFELRYKPNKPYIHILILKNWIGICS